METIEAVERINEEIFEQIGDDHGFCPLEGLYFRTDGFGELVEFLGERIWCSEDDERNYDEEKDDFEPIEDFLRRTIMGMINTVGKIKI